MHIWREKKGINYDKFEITTNCVNQIFNLNAFLIFLFTDATWYYYTIFLVITYLHPLRTMKMTFIELFIIGGYSLLQRTPLARAISGNRKLLWLWFHRQKPWLWYSPHFPHTFCRTLEGPAYTRLFNFRPYVRPYVRTYVRTSVSNLFSLLLLGQYTSDPQYFYRFRTPYKMTIRGAD